MYKQFLNNPILKFIWRLCLWLHHLLTEFILWEAFLSLAALIFLYFDDMLLPDRLSLIFNFTIHKCLLERVFSQQFCIYNIPRDRKGDYKIFTSQCQFIFPQQPQALCLLVQFLYQSWFIAFCTFCKYL